VVSPRLAPAAGESAAAATRPVPSGPPTTTVDLPETTAPEQLLLTWGADPATQVTVSWSAPGSVPMPNPALSYSRHPITPDNPGTTIGLPEPRPLDVTQGYDDTSAVSFTDGLNGQTTFYYHVQLRDLEPGTTYYYQVSDGAAPTPSTAGASFRTAPGGRAPFRFSSYGDLGTPSFDLSPSGYQWHQSCDNAYYAVSAVEDPGDGDGPPLFHLLNGDVSYANLDYQNAPAVWRDFGLNVSRSAARRPWMPVLGNHETEFGACDQRGRPGTARGGIRAQGAAGNYWNGPYGYGHYLSRFLLPDNGVVSHDGNRLRGNFYSFRVGTVQFVALDADDVIYQDSGACHIVGRPGPQALETTSGARIPNGTSTYNHAYTGDLKVEADAAVPDQAGGTPNLQTLWLERTLRAAREDDGIDMIVVFMHQCAMSSAQANGSDLGIRRAWLPLFDRYQVDLVLSGHEHNYERTFPVRGFDAGGHGLVVNANPGQVRGDAIDTRRPSVVTTEPATRDGLPAWDTERGTVFLVLGSGGTNCPSNVHRTNPDTGLPRAKVTTRRNATTGSQLTGFRRGGADAIEDAPWSAAVNATDAYGYAIFDVDPGQRPGETTITFQFFAIPAVTGTSGRLHDGGTTLPTKPYETCVFGRGLSRGPASE
jgi:Purple acid Phosphatase, N-terminal domain/Calcineurin-like phosphoesterase